LEDGSAFHHQLSTKVLNATLLSSLDTSNPGTYTASLAFELGSIPDHSESISQVMYKDDSLLSFLHGVASGSVSGMLVNVLETKNFIR